MTKPPLADSTILICGAGAIGGTVAAFFKRAGYDVVAVDAAEEHVAAIRSHGLRIEGPVSSFTVACDAVTPDRLRGEFDLVLLAVKAQHTRNAVKTLAPHLAPDGVIVSVQNGLNETVIAEIVGRDRTMGCFINFGADYLAPGKVEYGGRGAFVLGEIDGRMTDRLNQVHEIVLSFEPDAVVTDNIFGYLWSKMAFFALLISQTLSDVPTEEFLDDPKFRPLLHRIVGEVAKVANAEGIELMSYQGFDASSFLTADAATMNATIDAYADARRGSAKLHSGIWRDLAVRKRPTEVGSQSAPIMDAARGHGIDTPVFERAIEMIGAVEAGQLELSGALAEELLELAELSS